MGKLPADILIAGIGDSGCGRGDIGILSAGIVILGRKLPIVGSGITKSGASIVVGIFIPAALGIVGNPISPKVGSANVIIGGSDASGAVGMTGGSVGMTGGSVGTVGAAVGTVGATVGALV